MKKFYALCCAALMMGASAMAAPAEETISLEFENVQWADVVLGQGWWQLWGYNADSTYYVNISPNYTDHLDGVYDNSEMYYSKIQNANGVIQFVSGTHTLVTSDELIQLNSDVMGDDGNHYLLTVKYHVPEPEPVIVDIDIPTCKVNDQTAAEGWWQIYGYATDSMTYATFSTLNDPRLAGEFTMADMDPDYTYVIIMPGTSWQETIKFDEGTITVAVEGADTTLVANMVGKNGYYYNVTMASTGEVTSISKVSMTEGQPAVEKVYERGQLYIRRGQERYNAAGVKF